MNTTGAYSLKTHSQTKPLNWYGFLWNTYIHCEEKIQCTTGDLPSTNQKLIHFVAPTKTINPIKWLI